MSWTLGIDSSSTELGLGLCGPDGPVCSVSRYVANSHAEQITATVDFLLSSSGISPTDITRLGIAGGPGSFTGLRIGSAFMKGFCLKRDVAVVPVSSLESLACACPTLRGNVVAAFDARRGEVFWARFAKTDDGTQRLTEDTLMHGDRFAAELESDDTVVADTLGFSRSTVFSSLEAPVRLLHAGQCATQRGLACAVIAAMLPDNSPRVARAHDVNPVYLRPSYAEERRAQEPTAGSGHHG